MMEFDDRTGKTKVNPSSLEQQAANTVMRPLGNGQVQVINPATGQVLYTGSAAGASNSNANNGGMKRIKD